MNKNEFIATLQAKLCGLPKNEVNDRLNFYLEIINDKIEDGISEETAVAELGSIEKIADQIIKDIPFTSIVKEKITPKTKHNALTITLLVIGSPIWVSLLAAVFVVVVSVIAVIWSLVIVAWAVFGAFVVSSPAGIIGAIIFLVQGSQATALITLSGAFILAGLSILMFFAAKYTTIGIYNATKYIILAAKKCFISKED